MAKSERGPISLNLRNDKLEKPSKKDEGLYLRKDDANLESLSVEELKKLSAGIDARLKAVREAIKKIDEKEAVTLKVGKKRESKPVLAFIRPEEKQKKLTQKEEIKLTLLRKEKENLEKVLESRKNKGLDTAQIEADIVRATQEILDLEEGIASDDYLNMLEPE
jgi:hypothetical protein